MAKPNYSYEKRQRELAKKKKKEEKEKEKAARRTGAGSGDPGAPDDDPGHEAPPTDAGSSGTAPPGAD